MQDEEGEVNKGQLYYAMEDGNDSFENNRKKSEGHIAKNSPIFKMS